MVAWEDIDVDIVIVGRQASCERRASSVKKSVKEYDYPTKQQACYKKQVSTVEKLVAECGYPAKVVERAVTICGECPF